MMISKHVSVTGVVQGVGFRPYVYGLAKRLELSGWVCNTSAGVEIVVQGQPDNVSAFLDSLPAGIPPLARIDRLTVRDEAQGPYRRFEIRESEAVEGLFQPISADVAICPDCERELFNPHDRRYLYPFINCTNCGPRFTIIKDIPYDRPKTTMAEFSMCPACEAEYRDPLNRRFHAQPIACPECGPFVQLRTSTADVQDARHAVSSIELRFLAILKARRLLREGRIVAVKGLGGFHLACDASNAAAVAELRRRKGRGGKPFALMAADLSAVERICELDDDERALLTGREKPIVLLKRKAADRAGTALVSEEIAQGVDTLGVMLPYTPLHHLLINQRDPALTVEPVPPVLVMTSGNFSEEPIATENQDALERLAPLADAFLIHNRDIHIRCDDSVVRVDSPHPIVGGMGHADSHPPSTVYLRRSRGYAPYPINLPMETRPMLAVGGELKNTFCLARDKYAFLSQHIGDMENAETYESFERGVRHLSRLFRIQPEIVAHDLHPNYFTTRYALSLPDLRRVPVQHHHAHIAACMADNGLENRRVIGLSFDGTGYGADGAIWGGEVLIASYRDFERAAHLEYLPLPGGDAAIRHPWRIAVGYAHALGLEVSDLPFLRLIDPRAVEVVRAQVDKRINTSQTSSMGRLFDAAAALIGLRLEISYEAQAAIELETVSRPQLAAAGPYPCAIEKSQDGMIIPLRELLAAVIEDVRSDKQPGWIGARFHKTVARIALEVCRRVRAEARLDEVALSGGVWQNQVLLDLARSALLQDGFHVYVHRQTPANDGGLALGQALVAAYSLMDG